MIAHTDFLSWFHQQSSTTGVKMEKLTGREQEMVFAVSILWYCNIYC